MIYNHVISAESGDAGRTPAALRQGVAVVTQPAAVAGGPVGVVQTLEAVARGGVARARVQHVDVVVALAGLALAACLLGVAIETRGAFVTPGAWRREDGEQGEGDQ